MNRLAGPLAKLDRAREHIRELEEVLARFNESRPHDVVVETEASSGDTVWRFVTRSAPPELLSIVSGEVVHGLRSALDLMWWQLVELNGKEPARSDMFVISDDAERFERAFSGIGQRISAPARDLVRAIKPYRGGSDDLWRVEQLDIIDKHRLLLSVWANHAITRYPLTVAVDWSNLVGYTSGGGTLDTAKYLAGGLPFPGVGRVADGDELHRVKAGEDNSDVLGPPTFEFVMAIDEPEIVEPVPLVPLLERLATTVAETLKLFTTVVEPAPPSS